MCRGGHSSHKHPLQRSERLRHAAGIVKHDLFTPGGVLRYSLLRPRCPTTIDQRRPLRDAKLQTFEGEIATVRVHRADPADVVSVHRVRRRLKEDVVRSVREERLEVVCLLASNLPPPSPLVHVVRCRKRKRRGLPFLPERCCAVVRLAWARHVVVPIIRSVGCMARQRLQIGLRVGTWLRRESHSGCT